MTTAYLDDDSASVWIAEHEGVAIGYAIFQRAADEVELLRLGVDPAWRRAGVGGELVARGLAEAIDAGCAAGFLEVRADNRPARRLYERLGFGLVGRRARYYADGTEACVYRRELASIRG
jgi:ribosomal protein S18 acetylase RimI-like enzyme